MRQRRRQSRLGVGGQRDEREREERRRRIF